MKKNWEGAKGDIYVRQNPHRSCAAVHVITHIHRERRWIKAHTVRWFWLLHTTHTHTLITNIHKIRQTFIHRTYRYTHVHASDRVEQSSHRDPQQTSSHTCTHTHFEIFTRSTTETQAKRKLGKMLLRKKKRIIRVRVRVRGEGKMKRKRKKHTQWHYDLLSPLRFFWVSKKKYKKIRPKWRCGGEMKEGLHLFNSNHLIELNQLNLFL